MYIYVRIVRAHVHVHVYTYKRSSTYIHIQLYLRAPRRGVYGSRALSISEAAPPLAPINLQFRVSERKFAFEVLL